MSLYVCVCVCVCVWVGGCVGGWVGGWVGVQVMNTRSSASKPCPGDNASDEKSSSFTSTDKQIRYLLPSSGAFAWVRPPAKTWNLYVGLFRADSRPARSEEHV